MIRKFPFYAILAGLFVSASQAIYRQDRKSCEAHKKWVLLAASSKGWGNYRHQADVCHAYHLLKSHGIPEENIITMMYDDIAHNENNPYPGKIFNALPDSGVPEVYAGVKIDYKAEDVTSQNFLSILSGNASGVTGGNGRVIKSKACLWHSRTVDITALRAGPQSTKEDKIFVYLVDHGSFGYVTFPTDELTAKELSDTLHKMHSNKQYSELTFYLEACEAGSMFQGKILPADLNVFAMTASNPEEPSHGCYCGDHKIGTCVGDLFSVNWIADSEKQNISSETIKDQYETVKNNTDIGEDGSHVCTYGNLGIMKEHVADFQAQNTSSYISPSPIASPLRHPIWPSRDIPLLSLMAKRDIESDAHKRSLLDHQIDILKKKRQYFDSQMKALVRKVVLDVNAQLRVLNSYPSHLDEHLDCHHELVHTFSRNCFSFSKNPYALKYGKLLANFCELGLKTDSLVASLKEHCAHLDNDIQEIV